MSRRRALPLAAALVALVVSLLGVASGSPGQAAAPHAVAAAAKAGTPYYSDPVYYPVRQPMRMDCFRKNPGCTTHNVFQLDMTSPSGACTSAVSCPLGIDGNKVYAMGAGIVDRIDSDSSCGGSTASFGNEVNISHGGGVSSRYGHLATILVTKGQQVYPGTVIGTMGRTGAKECAGQSPYLDFYVDHGPDQVDFKTLYACVGGVRQSWPNDQFPQYSVWNDVPRYGASVAPNKTEFPHPVDHPADIPDGSCLPGAPVDPAQPAAPGVTNAGKGKLKVTFGPVEPSVDQIMTETQFYSVKNKQWLSVDWAYGIAPTATSHTVTGLADGTTARVRTAFHNADGWSVSSDFTQRAVGQVPLNPTNRSLKTVYERSKHSSAIQWSWKGGKQRGFPATKYILQIRKGKKGSWKVSSVPGTKYSHRFSGLKPSTTYQVRVKARCAIGDSGYLVKTIKTAKRR